MRIPAYPLIANDPYFSLWAMTDKLYGDVTRFWTGAKKALTGTVVIDGAAYCFMGVGDKNNLPQTDVEVGFFDTEYTFENEKLRLTVTFLSPLLLERPEVLSRPASYITFDAQSKDGKPHDVRIVIEADKELCYDSEPSKTVRGFLKLDKGECAFMGKSKQTPLNHSGDGIAIDWGYLYLYSPDNAYAERGEALGDNNGLSGRADSIYIALDFQKVKTSASKFAVVAYDDTVSVNYFGDFLRGYYTKNGDNFFDMLQKAVKEYPLIKEECQRFAGRLTADAKPFGEDYLFILKAAYRQSIAAHKAAAGKNGELLFISKECFSNGSAATADVSYPSSPLFFLYNAEYVSGMLRPIFKMAKTECWEHDFAPHDAGRYPYLTGQTYSMNPRAYGRDILLDGKDAILPYYYFPAPAGHDLYPPKDQMPLEECGNMLILSAGTLLYGGNKKLIADNLGLLKKWTDYLTANCFDTSDQLCTDDFAGHLAQNANLSAKAILGIAAYAVILDKLGKKADKDYLAIARVMAKEWYKKAKADGRTKLTFDNENSWSIKYNLVWDKILKTNLFDPQIASDEIKHYLTKQNKYGLPLDNRKDYTKSDWIMWGASLGDPRDVGAFAKPVADMLRESRSRVPFTDWYDTKTALQTAFQNRTVQAGLFMPVLMIK